MAKRHNKLDFLKTITQYGIHIWAILIIANATLIYAFHFSTQAANTQKTPVNSLRQAASPTVEPSPTEEPEQIDENAIPINPSLNLTFTIPGIGSGGGTMNPKRLKRNVTIFLYSIDANSLNRTVKPLYTKKATAKFDTNKLSPTYTSFLTRIVDLGPDVKEGEYQIAFRTDESLRTLIKESDDKVGGQSFGLNKNTQPLLFPPQTVLMGDTIPKEGDNLIDVSDYNAFVNCFGERNKTTFCTGNNYGDFDDNGVIDGVDYNILLLSFRALLKQGQQIPQITLAPSGPARVSRLSNLTSPTPKTEKKAKLSALPTPAIEPEPSGSTGNIIGGILFFVFLLILGAIGFVLYMKNEKVRNTIRGLLHLPPTAAADPQTTDPAAPAETATEENPDQTTTNEATAPVDPGTETPPTAETAPADQTPPVPETPAAPEVAPAAPAAAGDGQVEKDCFVKKKGPDEAGTGSWFVLTDDNGPMDAHYTGAEAPDGFAKVKGVMKTENGKTFLEISEIAAE